MTQKKIFWRAEAQIEKLWIVESFVCFTERKRGKDGEESLDALLDVRVKHARTLTNKLVDKKHLFDLIMAEAL